MIFSEEMYHTQLSEPSLQEVVRAEKATTDPIYLPVAVLLAEELAEDTRFAELLSYVFAHPDELADMQLLRTENLAEIVRDAQGNKDLLSSNLNNRRFQVGINADLLRKYGFPELDHYTNADLRDDFRGYKYSPLPESQDLLERGIDGIMEELHNYYLSRKLGTIVLSEAMRALRQAKLPTPKHPIIPSILPNYYPSNVGGYYSLRADDIWRHEIVINKAPMDMPWNTSTFRRSNEDVQIASHEIGHAMFYELFPYSTLSALLPNGRITLLSALSEGIAQHYEESVLDSEDPTARILPQPLTLSEIRNKARSRHLELSEYSPGNSADEIFSSFLTYQQSRRHYPDGYKIIQTLARQMGVHLLSHDGMMAILNKLRNLDVVKASQIHPGRREYLESIDNPIKVLPLVV